MVKRNIQKTIRTSGCIKLRLTAYCPTHYCWLIIQFLLISFLLNSACHTEKTKQDNNVEIAIKELQKKADSLYENTILDSAIFYYQKILDTALASGPNYYKQVFDNYNNIAFCKSELDIYNDAIKYFKESIKYIEFVQDKKDISSMYNNLGVAQMLNSEYVEALESFVMALTIDEDINNTNELSIDYNNIGKLYEAWKNFELAEQNYNKALELDKKNKDSIRIAIRMNSLGMLFKQQKQYEKALEFLKSALEMDEKLNNQKNAAIRKSNIGTILIEMKQHFEANFYLQQALGYFENQNMAKSIGLTKNAIGDNYILTNDYPKAEKMYLSSLTIANQINYITLKTENLKDLSALNQKKGDFSSALDYHLKFSALKDSIFNSENQKIINEYHIKYETEKKEKEIQKKEIELEKIKFQQNITKILVLALGLCAAFLFIIFGLKQRNSKIIELKNKELAELNATKDKFFAIVAHDLKTPISGFRNLTNALVQKFSQISQSELKEYLTEINHTSTDIQTMLNNLLQWSKAQQKKIVLDPTDIRLENLFETILSEFSANLINKNITIKTIVNNNLSIRADKNIITTILRNLISNAIKFSDNNAEIILSAYLNDNYIEFVVRDYGIGIKPEDIRKLFKIEFDTNTIGNSTDKGSGLGLILCAELIRIHKGEIWCESQIGKGSSFFFKIPV